MISAFTCEGLVVAAALAVELSLAGRQARKVSSSLPEFDVKPSTLTVATE